MDIINYDQVDSISTIKGKLNNLNNRNSKSYHLTTQELQNGFNLEQNFRNQQFLDSSNQRSRQSANAIKLGTSLNKETHIGGNGKLNVKDSAFEQKGLTEILESIDSTAFRNKVGISINNREGLNPIDNSSLCSLIISKLQASLKIGRQSVGQKYDDALYDEMIGSNFENSNYKLTSDWESKKDRIMNMQIDNVDLGKYHYHVGSGTRKFQDNTLESTIHSQLFASDDDFKNLLRTVKTPLKSLAVDNMRFEIFEAEGKMYVKGAMNGEALEFAESTNGVVELDSFMQSIDPKIFVGAADSDNTRRLNATVIRGNATGTIPVARQVRTVTTEAGKIATPATRVHTQPQVKCRLKEEIVVPVIERCEETVEHKVALARPELIEVVTIPTPPRVVVDTKVVERKVPIEVPVPVIEEKIVVKEIEKVIAEPPTHVHHIVIEKKDEPAALPPIQFHEEIEEGWPWWLWLLPLLCWIPLLAWLLCRKPKPAPVIRPKQPMAPVGAKQLTKPKDTQIMAVRTEERHSPERKYVIERKVVDEAEDIELEITKELQKSRAIRESRVSRAVSQGRQTAAEIAIDSAMSRGSRGGRRRRIKTIKKFGQTIGKEEQILDEDGNIISTRKIGLDEDEYASDQQMKSAAGSETYQERYYKDEVAPSSSAFIQERQSRRGYSSGRHYDNQYESSYITAGFRDNYIDAEQPGSRFNEERRSPLYGSREGSGRYREENRYYVED